MSLLWAFLVLGVSFLVVVVIALRRSMTVRVVLRFPFAIFFAIEAEHGPIGLRRKLPITKVPEGNNYPRVSH